MSKKFIVEFECKEQAVQCLQHAISKLENEIDIIRSHITEDDFSFSCLEEELHLLEAIKNSITGDVNEKS
jgi:hypothetical protein